MKAVSASILLALAPLVASTGLRPPVAPCTEAYTPFVSRGCYEDAAGQALIHRSSADQNQMTIEKCTAECKSNGFRYAGLKYWGVCYCGSHVETETVDASECHQACSGNKNQICGGDNSLSIYEDPTFVKKISDVSTDDYEPLGCYTDDEPAGRALSWQVDVPAEDFTTNTCVDACRKKGFAYAGTEYGSECWCGTNVGVDNVQAEEGQCDLPCAGDDSMNCGGHGHLNLYYAKDLDTPEPCGYEAPTTTTAPPVITTTTTAVTTTAPAPTCTSTQVTQPSCEFKAGNWCAPSLPDWTDKAGCLVAAKTCALQLTSCFKMAGWPGVQQCFTFGGWCLQIKQFALCSDCHGSNPTKCNKKACFNKYKPSGITLPTTTTVTTACPTSLVPTTTTAPVTTSTACPPEPTNICTQPTNDRYGYSADRPVAGIPLPVVSCNDVKDDFSRNPFKFYTHPDSRRCPSFSWNSRPNVCKEACEEQYEECKATYVRGCDKRRDLGEDEDDHADLEARTWFSLTSWFGGKTSSNDRDDGCAANDSRNEWCKKSSDVLKCWGKGANTINASNVRCKAQYKDCLAVNKRVEPGNVCKKWCQ